MGKGDFEQRYANSLKKSFRLAGGKRFSGGEGWRRRLEVGEIGELCAFSYCGGNVLDSDRMDDRISDRMDWDFFVFFW